MARNVCLWLFVLAWLTSLLPESSAIAVMSVDLGTEWMKIAIVSPGVPMEIALNKESKRKTPVAIAFRDGERTFGEDAANIGVRFPKNSYSYLLDLLAKKVDNPVVKLFQQRFPYYEIVPDPERGTVLFQHDSETQYSPEELLGMLLHKASEFAQDSAGQPIQEGVLTVPGYFNQAERLALLQAAELGGLKVLQLMNDYTAVALNYGIFHRKEFNETAQYIMFYDMGASSTTATVVSYQIVKTKEKGFVETNPQLSVIGVGFDRTLGGLEIQIRLRDYLAKRFNEMKKTTTDVFENPRAMAKLFKEAGRLKNVLSANAEHYAQVEGLLEEIDFKLKVTRDELEKICADVFDKVKNPIEQALKSSGLTLDIISKVILVGAGTRVPKVQERLSEIVAMDLGKSINTDEAAALGAVYKAADLSSGFKVKKFITKDAVIFPIQVVFERETASSTASKLVKRTLFGRMNPYPQKKIVTFNKHQTDFSFNVNYAELDSLPEKEVQILGPLNLMKVELSGVAEAQAKLRDENVESKGIKTHFALDDSGVLSLLYVELVGEKTLSEEELSGQAESSLSKLGSTISKLFTGSEDKKVAEEKPVTEETDGKSEPKKQEEPEKPVMEKTTEEDKRPEADESKNATKSNEVKPKVITVKEPIQTKVVKLGVAELETKQLQDSRKKLEALNEFDRQRAKRERLLNALESFVFDTQTKLETDEYKVATTEEEAEKIRDMCSKVADWLYEEGLDADADAYEAKLTELKTLTGPLYRRVREHRERPEALAALDSLLTSGRAFLKSARNKSGDSPDSLFTPVEMDMLEKILDETQSWKTLMEEEQAALPLFATPKLTVKLISEKIGLVDREVKYLLNKAKIWKPKKGKETNKTNQSLNNETVSEKDSGNATDEATAQEKDIEVEVISEEENEEPLRRESEAETIEEPTPIPVKPSPPVDEEPPSSHTEL